MPSLGIVFSVTFRIVLLRALNLAHFSDYFVRQPYIFWRELLRQQRESTTAFCSRRQQAEGLVVTKKTGKNMERHEQTNQLFFCCDVQTNLMLGIV